MIIVCCCQLLMSLFEHKRRSQLILSYGKNGLLLLLTALILTSYAFHFSVTTAIDVYLHLQLIDFGMKGKT
ncbi:CLUMA_CG008314, isoform A [Clunio marinus]|uniref:CLUMA_CG008314, isoform A n=1 Tax=Clunio marinus TaxID=568069 RepID=A0A1J1I5F5_9DIPT|nr:CLUMA_CG008314, isoform A [Clunio marinus]